MISDMSTRPSKSGACPCPSSTMLRHPGMRFFRRSASFTEGRSLSAEPATTTTGTCVCRNQTPRHQDTKTPTNPSGERGGGLLGKCATGFRRSHTLLHAEPSNDGVYARLVSLRVSWECDIIIMCVLRDAKMRSMRCSGESMLTSVHVNQNQH